MTQETAEWTEPAEPAEGYPEIDALFDSLPNKNGALIPLLHKAQEVYGYLSQEIQVYVAQKLNIPAAKVFGVATFYSLFNLEKKGQFKINVCLGTACYVRGAETILAAFEKELGIDQTETTKDGMFTLDSIRCVGACGLAPVVMIDDKVYGRVTPGDVKTIVDEHLGQGGQ
ncbi:MAG: NAD(P)H-dependent oxidoreductase subunit E [Clostridiales bacterium]|jgi:NADH:ubiquinone oxidoreductase subunit E|nr:NAD(P)H-dependent oxidoreductase subunit E [Clostridiales bacterium]